MNRERCLTTFLAFACALIVAAGCGGGGEAGGEEGAMEEEAGGVATAMDAKAATVDTATAATVSGTVSFTGTEPEAEAIDMSEEPNCAARYDMPKTTEEVVVGEGGGLANVFVYVKDGLSGMTFSVPSEGVVLDQAGCWYRPRVFGIQVGQDLVIKNSDGLLHNINAKAEQNRGFNISQPVEMETTRQFGVPEVMVRFECDVHGWMYAYVGVLEHPYYSVTGNDGSFSLDTLPPGTYTIEAWHERYGAQTQQVTVGANESAEVTFTFGDASA
ncbi:MAG: hypothetical protein GWN51_13945 [Gemmatimonadetes bacterium]|nr:hypothetical protein [Gemmatimonadota bacterium]